MAGSTHNKNYQLFLALLREAREIAEMPQRQLGEKLGNTQTFVSKMERGERRIDVVEFVEICDALDSDPIELLRAYLLERSKHSAPKSRSKKGTSRR